ncbi:MAG: cyclase family protein [Clostridiales bacterium]|nr:cyclase family protein [Clostridiales bacterium]
MKVIDLTHLIAEDMPVYPGTEQPKLAPANSYEADGFKETLFTMFSHTGTHMDPPAHLFAGRTTLDSFPIDQYVGKALVIDCRDVGLGGRIGMEYIEKVREKADAAEYLLFMTGWEQYWGKPEYFGEYPCVTAEVVDYLLATKKKGIGLDTIGLDPVADENLTLHKQLFTSGEAVVIENLRNLALCGDDLFTFVALPLRWQNADGSPIRAIALI